MPAAGCGVKIPVSRAQDARETGHLHPRWTQGFWDQNSLPDRPVAHL